MKQIVVVGGSIAAVTAAESLRAEGFDGRVVVLSEEAHRPYSRVPLSKGLLAGTASREAVFLPQMAGGIELRTGVGAVALDTRRRVVTLAGGDEVHYDGLVIATGARPRRLGADGELVVRSLDDADVLAAHLAAARAVIVVGAGFLGMEVASTCRGLGLDVTVVDRDPPLRRLLGPWLADFAVTCGRESGVAFHLEPAGVHLEARNVVRCGDRVLEADVVICAVGDVPNVEWLRGSGLPVSGGVVVDDCCRVAPGIVAAGDVVARSSPQGVLRRTPHWTNAVEQGRVAAAALLRGGEAVPCRPDLYFWTEMFGLNIKISGELPLDGEPEVVAGSVRYRAALLRWRRGGSSAAVAVNYRIPVSRLKRMASAPEVAPPATALYS